MAFDESQEQQILRETIRDFAKAEIAPHAREWDERQEFPLEVVRRLGKMGMLGALVDPEYGGAGLGYPEYVVLIEELARADGAIALSVAAHNSLCVHHIDRFGTEAQKSTFLPRLASGEALGAWALTEPGSGSDAAAARTRAVQDGGEWVLNGTKNFITHGTYADVFVVMAVTDPEEGARGMSAFIVEKGAPGLISGKKEDKLGCRASDTASVLMEECRIPKDRLLGERGQGFIDSLKVLDGGRIGIAAMALGLAESALECSIRYAQERFQFGQPIAGFQSVQFKLADMATRIEAARLLIQQAARLKEQGKSTPKHSSMAKLYASETAVWVAEQAIQIHGGYGYIKEYPPERIWRDAKICTIGEGTSEIQRIVISKEILA
ncbi:MAG TPA: acyl-CoA dehydrogenase family protein [Acidobacteriota bacterium]|nr:acyl-CoA dehydrogenase family protein [Acidobacteriota bacterium]